MDFLIMNRDTVVAEWIDNKLNLIKPSLAPMYLKLTSNVPKWLETRAIDSHRANSRLLKKALRLTERDDIGSVLSVNAVTITDNYWIKPLRRARLVHGCSRLAPEVLVEAAHEQHPDRCSTVCYSPQSFMRARKEHNGILHRRH